MIFKPPYFIDLDKGKTTIFLAGSIEMGQAENWQEYLGNILDKNNFNVINPRRDNWDSSWVQSYDNPQFYQQVSWELNGLELSDEILIYFVSGTKSPISLLEFGLYARSGKCSVVCPDEFWRKGNIDIVCNRYNIKTYQSIDSYIKDKLGQNTKIGFK